MRDFIICYINGERHELTGEHAFMTMAEYLRYVKGLTGTKIVCAEGDCGACTVMSARILDGKFSEYISLNSCIAKMYLYEGCHIITVEGLGRAIDMHPVQEVFVDQHGAQCGYCTPGFICALAGMAHDLKIANQKPCQQKVKNYLTGNLCRCTGYEPIIAAGLKVDIENTPLLNELYDDVKILKDYNSQKPQEIKIQFEHKEIYLPLDLKSACAYNTDVVKMISGATDLGVVENKGKLNLAKTLSLNNIADAYTISVRDHEIEVGAKASLSQLEIAVRDIFPELKRMLHIFASPQIKNAGTLVGNLVNASPIADTIPFLMVSDARVKIVSQAGEREVSVKDFFKGGYKELDLKSDELVKSVIIPRDVKQYKLYKVSVRKDLDISIVTFAASFIIENNSFKYIDIVYGGVGPTVIKMPKLVGELTGKSLTRKSFLDASKIVASEMKPLSDHRGSQGFRYQVASNLVLKFGDELMRELNPKNFEASI